MLVYAYDAQAPAKAERARTVLEQLQRRGIGVLSVQVLGEFYNVVTRRIAEPLSLDEAERAVHRFARAWRVLLPTTTVVFEAMRAVRWHSLSYYDALIFATASLNDVPCVLSEDFSDGHVLEGVRFVDPFAPAFDLAALE